MRSKRGIEQAARPEWLFAKRLKFYWCDTGTVEGIVVVNVELDTIADCHPRWRGDLVGRTMREFMAANRDLKVRRMDGDDIPESMMTGSLGYYHRHRCRRCREERGCIEQPEEECRNGLCAGCQTGRAR